MDHGNRKIITVDEVEVPHRKVGANRFAGKIERSADAFQNSHILIHCPFDKQHVKAERVTGRQIALHVAKCCDHLPANFSSTVVIAFVLTIEGAFPLSVDKRYWLGTSDRYVKALKLPFLASQILLAHNGQVYASIYRKGVAD